nr:FkbM family methyltransferase [Anaerolineae bacterium]
MSIMNRLLKAVQRNYKHWAWILPSRHYPYPVRGSRIFLNIAESWMMLARLLCCYEIEKHRALESFLRPGDVFIDIGANKGDFSLLAARLVGQNGQVLAFEPEPTNCHWVQKSITLNGYTNIALYTIALSDKADMATLYIGEKSGWHTLIPGQRHRDKGTISVKTRTLDDCLREQGVLDSVNVIKIDVEGAEMSVLQGASETLARNRDLIVLLDIHPQLGVSPEAVCAFLRERDFQLFAEEYPFLTPVSDCSAMYSIIAKRTAPPPLSG